mmetsp:Transcript_417/g.1122  ORF Transcript_417/g.1122 Transcript_417/m.1122 type:complete len:272 (+) Transcript_417:1127-1942(+)
MLPTSTPACPRAVARVREVKVVSSFSLKRKSTHELYATALKAPSGRSGRSPWRSSRATTSPPVAASARDWRPGSSASAWAARAVQAAHAPSAAAPAALDVAVCKKVEPVIASEPSPTTDAPGTSQKLLSAPSSPSAAPAPSSPEAMPAMRSGRPSRSPVPGVPGGPGAKGKVSGSKGSRGKGGMTPEMTPPRLSMYSVNASSRSALTPVLTCGLAPACAARRARRRRPERLKGKFLISTLTLARLGPMSVPRSFSRAALAVTNCTANWKPG